MAYDLVKEQKALHQDLCKKNPVICEWYEQRSQKLELPFYSSFDIRDSGFKVSNVDGNIYPAGFNNICPTDKESSVDLVKRYVDRHYDKVQKILLICEEHTQNAFYWENVSSIQSMIKTAGYQVCLAFPKNFSEPVEVQSSSGKKLQVYSGYPDQLKKISFEPDLVISNNDFSQSNEEWAEKVSYLINPPRELGWYQRKKSRYFKFYNQLVHELSDKVGFDPFMMTVETQVFDHFDLSDEKSLRELKDYVDDFLQRIAKLYLERKIDQKPFVFVKNNSGTYGLAVMKVDDGAQILDWNNKSKKKMKAAKGGREVEEVIIQEGIPTRWVSEGASSEPVIYMIGSDLAGGFLRTHSEKNTTESLNSPGAVFKKLCVSDLNVSVEGSPLENVYGWTAKLGVLAIGQEAHEMGVAFKGYR